jgi:hypothetical protein
MEQHRARSLLAEAVRRGEKTLMKRGKSGQASWKNDPYVALTALAVCASFVLNGEGKQVQVSVKELLQLQQFIVTCDEYVPSAQFPFTKDQLRQAWESAA